MVDETDDQSAEDTQGRADTGETAEEQQEPDGRDGHDRKRLWRIIVEAVVSLGAMVVVLMWLAGVFEHKIEPGLLEPTTRSAAGKTAVEVKKYSVPRYEWAVGTIKAVNETALGSKLLAKVVEVKVKAGQFVKKNEVLVRLDDRDLQARVAQAKSAVEAAEARRNQARVDHERIMRLAERQAASEHEISTAGNELKKASAQLQQAKESLREAETILSYATIRAPFDGIIVDKNCDVGDMVVQGRILVRLYDRLQFVATVRESLAEHLKVGQGLYAYVPAVNKVCRGTVSEIVPQAEVASRSFDVKLIGPCAPGIYSGMFGRMFIPLGREEVILIPKSSIVRVGQLELVDVEDAGGVRRRSIQVGRSFGDYVEVLSGLNEGEKVLVPSSAAAATPGPPSDFLQSISQADSRAFCPVPVRSRTRPTGQQQ